MVRGRRWLITQSILVHYPLVDGRTRQRSQRSGERLPEYPRHDVGTGRQVQLRLDVPEVERNRGEGDVAPRRDLGIAVARGDQFGDVPFARREHPWSACSGLSSERVRGCLLLGPAASRIPASLRID